MSEFKYLVGFLSKGYIMLLFACINAAAELFFCFCVRSNSAIFDQQQFKVTIISSGFTSMLLFMTSTAWKGKISIRFCLLWQ